MDGELPPAEMQTVAAEVDSDPQTAVVAARLGEIDVMLRAAHAAPLTDAVPEQIHDVIRAGFAARQPAGQDTVSLDGGLDALLRDAFDTPMQETVPDAITTAISAGFAARRSERTMEAASLDGLLREAFDAPMAEAAPEAITATISREFQARRDAMTAPVAANSNRMGWLRIAASVLVVIGGAGFAGYFGGQMGQPSPEAQLALARAAAQEAVVLTLGQALEKQVSGQMVNWSDPETGLGAEITPVRTFKSASGQWCREYVQRFALQGAVETRRGIACRTGEGQWATEVERPEAAGTSL